MSPWEVTGREWRGCKFLIKTGANSVLVILLDDAGQPTPYTIQLITGRQMAADAREKYTIETMEELVKRFATKEQTT